MKLSKFWLKIRKNQLSTNKRSDKNPTVCYIALPMLFYFMTSYNCVIGVSIHNTGTSKKNDVKNKSAANRRE